MDWNSNIVTLCFPPRCLGCGQEISPFQPVHDRAASLRQNHPNVHFDPGQVLTPLRFDFDAAFAEHWCSDCWRQLTVGAPFQCRRCGASFYREIPLPGACSLCHGTELRFERAVSSGNYRGLLQDLVIRMKNQHDEQIAVQLGHLLAFELIGADFVDEINLVVPAPTHWWRRVRRGFQAAEVVSETIASGCDLPYAGQIMRCLRGTRKQGTLSTPARFKNVRGAFDVRPNVRVDGLNILLVDDVMTSGATASELARMLIARGAAKVYAGVIARGARVS